MVTIDFDFVANLILQFSIGGGCQMLKIDDDALYLIAQVQLRELRSKLFIERSRAREDMSYLLRHALDVVL